MNIYKAIDVLEQNPMTVINALREMAQDPISDHAQVLARVRASGGKTVVFGIEPENFEED